MTHLDASSSRSISYPTKSLKRADRAVRCSPFHIHLFITMWHESVALRAIAGAAGVQNRYTDRMRPEIAVESDLMWLIQVGVLRREVDGQGLTDSFRLTPLGRQLVERWQQQGGRWSRPSWVDYVYDSLNRWLRLSL